MAAVGLVLSWPWLWKHWAAELFRSMRLLFEFLITGA
jgi:hypothetical protein